MKEAAEVHFKEQIADIVFVQSDVAVGSSVTRIYRIYRLLTSHIGELKNTPCFWAAFLSLFEKDNPFDWSQDRNSDRGGRCG